MESIQKEDLLEFLLNYEKAKKPSELMAKPALSFEEFFVELLGLPASTAEVICKGHDAPPMFALGRRRYIRTSDAIEWIDEMARQCVYVPRRNNRKVGAA